MLLAIGFHVRRHESPVAPGILFLRAVFGVFLARVSKGPDAAVAGFCPDHALLGLAV